MDNQNQNCESVCGGQEELADLIIRETCKYYGVLPEQFVLPSRKRQLVIARQVSAYFMRTETGLSLKQIGKKIGDRDHSTVIYAKQTIEDLCDSDRHFKEQVEEVEVAIKKAICGVNKVEYVPYGEEWTAEVMKWRKEVIIGQLRKALIEKDKIKHQLELILKTNQHP